MWSLITSLLPSRDAIVCSANPFTRSIITAFYYFVGQIFGKKRMSEWILHFNLLYFIYNMLHIFLYISSEPLIDFNLLYIYYMNYISITINIVIAIIIKKKIKEKWWHQLCCEKLWGFSIGLKLSMILLLLQ